VILLKKRHKWRWDKADLNVKCIFVGIRTYHHPLYMCVCRSGKLTTRSNEEVKKNINTAGTQDLKNVHIGVSGLEVLAESAEI
jgi:hypothetical protein